jgi:hypothetical protein
MGRKLPAGSLAGLNIAIKFSHREGMEHHLRDLDEVGVVNEGLPIATTTVAAPTGTRTRSTRQSAVGAHQTTKTPAGSPAGAV